MPHIITQSCCSDGSCVYACPVNCIHPSPDEPGFATAEMLYIDPVACVDCGACVSACPVGAIAVLSAVGVGDDADFHPAGLAARLRRDAARRKRRISRCQDWQIQAGCVGRYAEGG